MEYLGADGKIILKRIFKKYDVRMWNGLFWLMLGTSKGLF